MTFKFVVNTVLATVLLWLIVQPYWLDWRIRQGLEQQQLQEIDDISTITCSVGRVLTFHSESPDKLYVGCSAVW